MSTIHAVMWTLHVGFAVLWTGSVLFVSGVVLPAADRGVVGAEALDLLTDRLRWITRIAGVVFVVTGGHMAGTIYTTNTLTGTGRGHLVMTMIALWFLITGLVEVGGSRVDRGSNGPVSDVVDGAHPAFFGAGILSVLLLITAGLLANPFGL